MTDEEKAEEYAEGKAHEHYHFLFEENNGSPVDFAKLCYLDGLIEGRKEEDEKLFNNWCKGETPEPQECPFLQKLEKENETLTKRILELQKTCGALTDKVEEVKNAGNCKHFMECAEINEKEFILGNIVTCKGCKKWEMVE